MSHLQAAFPIADPFCELCWKTIEGLCTPVKAILQSEFIDGSKTAKAKFLKVLTWLKQVQNFNVETSDGFMESHHMLALKSSFIQNPFFKQATEIAEQKIDFYEQQARATVAKEVREVGGIAYGFKEGLSWHELIKTSGGIGTSYDLLLAAAQEPDSLLVSGGVKRSDAIENIQKAIDHYKLELQKLGGKEAHAETLKDAEEVRSACAASTLENHLLRCLQKEDEDLKRKGIEKYLHRYSAVDPKRMHRWLREIKDKH